MRAIPREVNDTSVRDADEAYALGLWCADGYWWSSSVGLSNVEPELLLRFARYLSHALEPDRMRLRIYAEDEDRADKRLLELTSHVSWCKPSKMRRTAYHLYVNSRPLLRRFQELRLHVEELALRFLGPYLAGRFDGDGCLGNTIRIAYTKVMEANLDRLLLSRAEVRTSLLYYAKANEYCIYVHRSEVDVFLELIKNYSWKVQCRFTL
jgi:hypothetical protein